MDLLSLDRNQPHGFILAATETTSEFDAGNDQVWSLSLDKSSASPFRLHTTYQLRAKSMQLFPNLIQHDRQLAPKEDFNCLPRVIRYLPGYLQLLCRLTNGVEIMFDFFVPASDAIAGIVAIKNGCDDLIDITLQLATKLVPMGPGTPTHPDSDGIHQIISGQTEDLYPVLMMSGGPRTSSNPFPSLTMRLQLIPGQTHPLTWSLVTKQSQKASFKAAQKYIGNPLPNTLRSQLMKYDSQYLSIQTGNPDWDAVFSLAQTHALTHLIPSSSDCPPPCFIRNRLPDRVSSNQHPQAQMDDITTLEALHLSQVILPSQATFFTQMIEKFLTRIDAVGRLISPYHSCTSLSPRQECPLLSHLALDVYQITQDEDFLHRIYPDLLRVTERWLNQYQKSDENGPPALECAGQLQLSSGIFLYGANGEGMDVHTVDSPALAAMLFSEVRAIQYIAKVLSDKPIQKRFSKHEKVLKEKIKGFWQADRHCFGYFDRESGYSPSRELHFPGPVKPRIDLQKIFSAPQRLQCHVSTKADFSRTCILRLIGEDSQGNEIIEEFKSPGLRWMWGQAHVTSANLFNTLSAVTFDGFDPEGQFLLETADFSQVDITCLLPIWAGAASQDQIETISRQILSPDGSNIQFGIPETWQCRHNLPEDMQIQVNVVWNTLILEGLVQAGYSEQALPLFTSLMTAIVQGLKDFNGFYPYYDALNGHPAGDPYAIAGLAPIKLFLQIAGIRLFSPVKVALWGESPFPGLVTVHWQGLSIEREGKRTEVVFPDGTRYASDSEKPILLTAGREMGS